jgi:hypothetical protein
LQLSNFSVHLSTLAAKIIIKPLESAKSATHVLRFMGVSFQISTKLVQQKVRQTLFPVLLNS